MHQINNILLSIQYFPCIQFFSKCLKAKTIYLEQHENYVKQSYRNRAVIYTANGIFNLTVPVIKSNSKQQIRSVKIAYAENWQQVHFRAIQAAYQKSPYYEFYMDYFVQFFEKKYTFLWDFNLEILKTLFSIIGITALIKFTSKYEDTVTNDYRYLINLKTKNNIKDNEYTAPIYIQVFEEKHGFISNLSILDLLFNEGPATKQKILNSIIEH